ncbi:MAG: peptidylprolyl isomerase [Nitrospirae bacterium]|nr:peptidylprolyl isomerase [Nitrospirota bacterium]
MIRNKIVYPLIFLFVLTSYVQATFLLDRVVAVVNQDVITWSELYRFMEVDASPAVKALPEEERKKIFLNNETLFLESLIELRLQVQEAANSRVKVVGEEVKETIEGIKKKYGMTDSQFQDSLKSEGYTFEEYKRRLVDQLLQSKIVNQQVRSKVLVSDADVDNFMKENKDMSSSAGSYHIRQIFFKKPKDPAERALVEEKALAVYAKAGQGQDFAELARLHSEDATRNSGGDLGYIEKGILGKEFLGALSAMKQGDVSKPFWSDRGMHILMLEETAAPRSAAELKEDAKIQLQEKLFNEKYKAWIKSLREKSFIDIRL